VVSQQVIQRASIPTWRSPVTDETHIIESYACGTLVVGWVAVAIIVAVLLQRSNR